MDSEQEEIFDNYHARLEQITLTAGDIPQSIVAWQEFVIVIDKIDITQTLRPQAVEASRLKIKQAFQGELTEAHAFIKLLIEAENLYNLAKKG